MAPRQIQISLPHTGWVWLEGEEQTGRCDDVPVEKWIRKRSGASNFFLHADGPSGSGRYWDLRVGVSDKGRPKPKRGVCFATSTVGWRTLQEYKVSPLPWLGDLDHDGKAEFILWDSFPLREDASMAEYGLTAWVYRLESKGVLVIDWDLSRRMAREIAAAYRAPLKADSPSLRPLRAEAAAALEAFADESCAVPPDKSR